MDGQLLKMHDWFPQITIILCFLHAFIKIRDRAALAISFNEVATRVWDTYKATSIIFTTVKMFTGMDGKICT